MYTFFVESLKKNLRLYLLLALFLTTGFIWYVVLNTQNSRILKVAILDIGQGDAIFIEAPNGNQMLIDGGPPKNILSALKDVMPFYDRSIDVVMVTNPDQDHIGGFIDVLNSYKVGEILEPGTDSPSATYSELERIVSYKKIEREVVNRGEVIWLDREHGVHFDVLFPDRDVLGLATNDGSIVGRLVYGATSVMFTGDSPSNIEHYLARLDGKNLKSDVLKVGHHGSRTSTSEEFVGLVDPKIAVISDGKGNKYGHPHKETLDTLEKFGVKVLRTDLVGAVILESDGENLVVK